MANDAKVKRPSATMTIEPMPPAPTLRDGAVAPPYPSGLQPPNIAPLEKAGPGWKATPAPANPKDWLRPGFTGITRI